MAVVAVVCVKRTLEFWLKGLPMAFAESYDLAKAGVIVVGISRRPGRVEQIKNQ